MATDLISRGMASKALKQYNDMTNYSTVAAAANVYTIDFANSPVKNVKIKIKW